MTKPFILALALMLTGCSLFRTSKVPVDTPVPVAPSLLEECPKLEKLPETASFEDVLEVSKTNFKLYAKCAQQQHNSIVFINEVVGKK